MTYQDKFFSTSSTDIIAEILYRVGTKGPCCCCVYHIGDLPCFDANCVRGISLWLAKEYSQKKEKTNEN